MRSMSFALFAAVVLSASACGTAPPPATGVQPAPSSTPWEQARARGAVFRGIGTEPGWIVEVGSGDAPELRAQLDYGERTVIVPRAQELDGTQGYGGRTHDGVDVVLRIVDGNCSDGMSDETYPAGVELRVGDLTYVGCGRYLGE